MNLRHALLTLALPVTALAHTMSDATMQDNKLVYSEALRQHIADEFVQNSASRTWKLKPKDTLPPKLLQRPVQLAGGSGFDLSALLSVSSFQPPAGNGLLMAASFAPFKPKIRYNWDPTTCFVESDNTGGDNMPNKMVGITSWQQQVPIPAAYFAHSTNNENNAASLGYLQPNHWRIPLVPTPSASPIVIYNPPAAPTNFLRGAVALGSNGIAIFNPSNNGGNVSYEIGELDYYGGHCGLADDYHYHIIPTHLSSRFGGPLGDDKPVAWALDGYPIYGFVEPDGSARQAMDADGGHDHGNGWGYHYHAMGTTATNATHPYGTPQSPYMMKAFHGTVVNFGSQVDGQPEVGSLRGDGTGGYNAKPVAGASIVAMINPAALTTDGSGNYIQNTAPGAPTSPDAYIMRVNIGGTNYDECWTINRMVNPRSLTMTWRAQALISGQLSGPVLTTTQTYTPAAGGAAANRLTAYPMGAWSEAKLPDTSQVLSSTTTFGEDSDYQAAPEANPQSFTDNGNGTITDNVTGLMWQKADNGETTWENAINNAPSVTTGGYTDWRLPNPQELFSIMNHENGNPNAMNTTYFPTGSPAAEYWWTRDIFGTSTTNVWCINAGGGLGPKPKAETLSAGGTLRYHARYVRLAQNNMTHNYTNNGDGTLTDTDTALMWTQMPSTAMSWDSALTYAENLTLAGYSDWRMPNIKELQTLTDYALATTSGGTATNLKPAIHRTLFAKTMTGCGTTLGIAVVTTANTTDLAIGMTVVDPYSVAGSYINHTTTPTITAINPNVSFTLSSNAIATGAGLTLRALPRATAYWSSTSNKGTQTEAWLLELGVNNAVPALEGPPRGSQGIISYQAKTASFPIFTVRTAVMTTQIAVSQGATSLTDSVSTVSYGNVNVGSSLSKTFTINNTGSTPLDITGVTIDGTNSAHFSVTSSPATPVTAGGSTTFTVLFNALTAGSKVAALHIASSDPGNTSFDVNLAGTGFVPPPTISNITVNPVSPTSSDPVTVTAQVTAGNGGSLSGVQLAYSTGTTATATIFNEPMASVATVTGGWDQTASPAANPWTLVFANGNGNITQVTAANHADSANPCGLQFNKGTNTTPNSATTTNVINASGSTGYIEFWLGVSNITTTGLGWTFQLSTDSGTTWAAPTTGQLSEFAVANHALTKFHYDLLATERVSTLKLRFNFYGNGLGGATGSKVQIDDIIVVTTAPIPPTTLTMYDDGTHGDAVSGDGIYTGTIPTQANDATVNFTIAATGTSGSGTSTSSATSFTVAPAPTITTASPLPAGNTLGAYTPVTFAATGGTGTGYTWSLFAGALPNGLILSGGGVLSGATTAAGNYNFTVKVTDSASRSATKAFSLTISGNTAPNVVIIVTDDQGWGDVGYHTPSGQVPIQTPNMDSFGTSMSGSIRLERFYATTVCSVTRATLMTGRNAIRHATNNERGLDLSEHLMPQTFKAAGYQTFMCGKWHLGGSDKNIYHFNLNGNSVRVIKEGLQYAPFYRGWDSHYGQYSGAIDYFTHHSAEPESLDVPDWWLNGVQQDGASEHTDSRGYGGWSPTLLADKAIAHIQNRNPAQPMLLHLAFNSIHGPVSAPAALITKYQNLGITNTNRRLIAAAIDGMDQEIGRVLAALDAAGIANNTLVVWFGDNGGDETKGSLNDPLRGTKGDSYEGGMREPAGIRWPGVLPTGVISNQYLWVGDVFPTICAAVGVTPQNTKPLDGLNLWPAMLSASNTTTVSRGSPLVTVTAAPISIYQFTDPVNGGIKDFKIIRSKVGTTTVTELYNLTDDPGEATDLIANSAYASIVTTLTNAITAIPVESFKPYVGPPLITNAVPQGGTITLYAPFTSWPSAAPSVQWRKGGVNVAGGVVTQITDDLAVAVRATYAATLTLTNVSPSDAGTYDVVVTNNVGSTTSDAGALTVTFGAPILTALPTYTQGSSRTISWPAVAGANSFTVQRSATADFASILSSQTVSTLSATFTSLTSGTQYFYRATASDGTSTSVVSNTVSSTQDAGNPSVAITSPANNTTVSTSSVTVQGTASDAVSGLASVVVNGVPATITSGTWTASVPLANGANTVTATATDNASNTSTASITVTLNAVSPVIANVSTGPTAPTYLDPTTIYAQVTAGAASIQSVQLMYDTGAPLSTKVWQEIFANTSSNNWNGTGAINPWTTVGGGVVRQAVSTSNHTVISVSSAATTSGSTTVTCASTANLWPGMLITGTNIPGSINGTATGNTTIASIANGTTFILSQPATATGSGLTLNVASVVLTNAVTTAASTAVTCDSTAGLINGMSLTGTGLANNATVASVTSATTFTMNASPTTPGTVTITAGSAAAEFNGGTAVASAAMFTTTNAINTTGASGYVEFWVQTRDLFSNNNCGWLFQVSPDNGTTWNTRLSEDWTSKTINLTNVVINGAGASAGSTTVTCADTTGLTVGRSVACSNLYVTCGLTTGQSTVTCTDVVSSGLLPGMALQGTGIPNNSRIGIITVGTSPAGSFTLVTGTTATAVTATATNAATAIAATYFPAATISSITNGTTFVLNTPAYVNTSAAPIAATATTINHAAQLFHYDLVGAELGSTTKLRFQATGYTATAPTRTPRISIDDIVVATTAPPPTVTVTMYDDGLHGDGLAGDGLYAAQIPAQLGGTTINFQVRATDSAANVTTSPGSSNYSYTVASLLTDATILGAEFLTLPKNDGITVNLIAAVDQNVFVEYGTQPGNYASTTTPTLFTVDSAKPEFRNPIRIPITGLQPDTEYYYRVRHKTTGATFYSARGERSFHTARPRGTTFSFTVTADPHIDVNTDMQLFWRAMQNISIDTPDLHLDVGDIFMTDKLADGLLGVPPKWGGGVTINQTSINNRAIIFRNAFERACHSIPFFFGLGNHEAEYGYLFSAATDKQNNIPAWDLKARKAFYPAPTTDTFYNGNPTPKDYTGGTLGLLEDYYAFEWGEALFITLDPFWNTMTNPSSSNDAWNWSLGQAQYNWLRDTLKNSSAKYKFVFMHHIVGGSTQAIISGVPTPQYAARGGIEVSDKYEWGGNNADGSAGFATKRPGWDMPIHDLLVLNKVSVVFHGHDHLYGYQTKDGIVYLECPQPGTPNYSSLGSAVDGQYVDLGANSTSQLLPNSGHIRVTVGPNNAVADYVRSYRTATDPMPPDANSVFNDETAARHNRDISHSFVLAPRVMQPIEVANVGPGGVGLRWNAVPNKPYQIQWSVDLATWTTIDTLTFTNTNTNATYTDTLPAHINGQRAFWRVSYTP